MHIYFTKPWWVIEEYKQNQAVPKHDNAQQNTDFTVIFNAARNKNVMKMTTFWFQWIVLAAVLLILGLYCTYHSPILVQLVTCWLPLTIMVPLCRCQSTIISQEFFLQWTLAVPYNISHKICKWFYYALYMFLVMFYCWTTLQYGLS